MKKLTLYIMSAFLLYPTTNTCGKHKHRKKQNKINYGIIRSPEGISVIYTAILTSDEKSKLQIAINEIAQIDESIEQCEKGSEQILEFKKQIAVIEARHHLRRLPRK